MSRRYLAAGWAAVVAASTSSRCRSPAPRRSPMSAGRAASVPDWLMVGDVVVRACCGCRLPLYLFPSLDPGSQVIAASLIAGLGIAALGLVVVPACVIAWMAVFTAGALLRLARRPQHRAVPAYAVDPVHAGRRHLRRAHRRPLGVRAVEDQRRFRLARAKARACCCRNMSSAASAGCGRSMAKIASPTSPRA